MSVRRVSETATTVTLGWDPVQGQQGYVATIDGSDIIAGKRRFSGSQTRTEVTIGKLLDGQPHSYGVNILGVIAAGSVTSPEPVPSPMPFTKIGVLWQTQDPMRKADVGGVNSSGDGWWNSGSWTLDDVPEGVRMGITTGAASSSGIRGTRVKEPQAHQQFYAEARYLIPVLPTIRQWAQCQQIKSYGIDYSGTYNTAPFWFVTMSDSSGVLKANLTWWGGLPFGPKAGLAGSTARDYPLSKSLPIGRPFTLGMAVKQSAKPEGRVVVVLDGEIVGEQADVITGFADAGSPIGISRAQWCFTNYGHEITPSPFVTIAEHAAVWAVSGL